MLNSHFAAVESSILAQSGVAKNAGHNLHRGTPREVFIKEFLEQHLSERLGIGTGEIIDSNSEARAARNQIDIVIYRKDYPRLTFGGGISAFLAESVLATIEIKSILNYSAVEQSVGAAVAVKKLNRSFNSAFQTGHEKPGILSFVVAYDGPEYLTVTNWLQRAHEERGVVLPRLPTNHNDCQRTSWPSIDGIFLLGKGFLQSDTSAISYINDDVRLAYPSREWIWCESEKGSLLMLFMLITQAGAALDARWLNGRPYMERFKVDGVYLVGSKK